ncbi:MAG: phosphatase PAP2 family protein [Oscillospiraceae bacterium]|nr:phosphatase PAP2 family protein [Oscillospiraceae bacterium]
MKEKKISIVGITLITAFIIWTILIQIVDVQAIGVNGTDVGFATINCWFHKLTGENMAIYYITDWMGLIPILSCMIFGVVGFIQLIKRKSLLKVDLDIIFLGIYYIVVILAYLFFEMIPINYRPILIEGTMEVSYPSSTTLLVLSVMPTVSFQNHRRIKNITIRNVIYIFIVLFSLFMAIGRTVSGVHWLTDIIGSILFSIGLYLIYKSIVMRFDKKRELAEVNSGIQ